MPSTSLGPRLHIDGEEEYRSKIKQIIEQAKTLDAQMAAVTASFDKNTTAEEKASKTSEIIAQQIQKSEERVALLRDMVDKATKATGENSEATLKWKQALYAAEEQKAKNVQKAEALKTAVEEEIKAIEEESNDLKTIDEQIESLDLNNKALEASLRALNEQWKGEADKKQLLIEQNKIYAEQADGLKDKVYRLYDSLAAVENEFGKNSDEAKKLQIEIANTSAEVYKCENAISANNKALDDMSETMEDTTQQGATLGDQVQSIADKLGIKLPDGAKKALDGFDGLSTRAVAKLGAIAAAATAAIETVKKLKTITDEAAHEADDLLTQSSTSGLSTDMLQQIQYAAPYVDVEASTITSALTKIISSMDTARDQTAAYTDKVREAAAQGKEYEGELGAVAAAFQTLGVSVTDSNGELRDNNDVLFDVLASLNEVGNASEREALAQQLLGKGARELNPLIQNLDEAQRLYNEAIEEGYVLSKADLERLGAVDDAHNKLTQTIERNKNMIAVQWAPANQAAYEAMAKLADGAGKALIDSKLIENGGKLVEAGAGLFTAVMDVVGAGAKLIDSLPGWLNPINLVKDAMYGLSVVSATVADSINLITGIVTLDRDKVGTALGLNQSKGIYSNLQKLEYSQPGYVDYTKPGPIPTYNAAGTDFFQGGGTWVGEAGPEYVQLPRGSRIYSNQQSRELLSGGDTIYNITVANVEELDEIIDWYETRRIRERMG